MWFFADVTQHEKENVETKLKHFIFIQTTKEEQKQTNRERKNNIKHRNIFRIIIDNDSLKFERLTTELVAVDDLTENIFCVVAAVAVLPPQQSIDTSENAENSQFSEVAV